MCGIAFGFSNNFDDIQSFSKQARSLSHRGPDGFFVTHGGDAESGHWVGIQARLVFTGGTNAFQPHGLGQGVLGWMNGEAYDWASSPLTENDTGWFLKNWHEKGDGFLDETDWEGCAILWDPQHQRLKIARDRFGVKPLRYIHNPDAVWIASEAKAFSSIHAFEWDETSVSRWLALQYWPKGKTLFKKVSMLMPGEVVTFERGATDWSRTQDDWRKDRGMFEPSARLVNLCSRSSDPLSPTQQMVWDTWVEEIREALVCSVLKRIDHAPHHIVAHVSGGMDSCGIAGIALFHQREVGLAHVSFPQQEGIFDESAYAQAFAAHYGRPLIVVSAQEAELKSAWDRAIWHAEAGAINTHLPAKYLLNHRLRQLGYRAVLTGEGADEMFGGYAHFMQEDEWAHEARGLQWKGATVEPETLTFSGLMHAQERGQGPAWLWSKRERALQEGWLSEAIVAHEWEQWHQEWPRDAKECPVSFAMRSWRECAMSDYILKTLGDGMEAAHGLEGRIPFLSTPVWNLVRQLPPDWHWRGRQKNFLREVLRPFVPSALLNRPKHPFRGPPLLEHQKSELRIATELSLNSLSHHFKLPPWSLKQTGIHNGGRG